MITISNLIQLFHLLSSDTGKLPSDSISMAFHVTEILAKNLLFYLKKTLSATISSLQRHKSPGQKYFWANFTHYLVQSTKHVTVNNLFGHHSHCSSCCETLILYLVINCTQEPQATFTVTSYNTWKLATLLTQYLKFYSNIYIYI